MLKSAILALPRWSAYPSGGITPRPCDEFTSPTPDNLSLCILSILCFVSNSHSRTCHECEKINAAFIYPICTYIKYINVVYTTDTVASIPYNSGEQYVITSGFTVVHLIVFV